MARKQRLSLKEYSKELPPGIILKYSSTAKNFTLMKGGFDLATRPEKVVRQWENPARVFAFIARSITKMEPQEKTTTEQGD
jgi:hypothetical protein